MTVEISASEGGIPHNNFLGIGLVGSVVCLYLAYLNVFTGMDVFSVFGGIAAVFALWWGTDTIKNLCSYGLGTGVPSAGMLAFGSGVIAMLLATRLEIISPLVIPVGAVVIAAILGAIIGIVADKIVNMHIPVMVKALTEMAIVGALTLLGLTAMASGSFVFSELVAGTALINVGGTMIELPSFAASALGGCVLATLFMLGAIALQHPFNACLGPNESQDRTQMLALECGFLSMIPVAVISFVFISSGAALIGFLVSVIGWAYTYMEFIKLSKRDAYMWLDGKPILEKGGE